ncbi:unnamed protein product [Arctogadus glacialis]
MLRSRRFPLPLEVCGLLCPSGGGLWSPVSFRRSVVSFRRSVVSCLLQEVCGLLSPSGGLWSPVSFRRSVVSFRRRSVVSFRRSVVSCLLKGTAICGVLRPGRVDQAPATLEEGGYGATA